MRSAVAVALVVALLTLTGCLGGIDGIDGIDADVSPDAEPVETNETGDEILASAVNASEDAEAYTVEGEHRFVAGAGGLFDMNLSMASDGSFDTEDDEALVSTDGTVDFTLLVLDNTTEFETTVYADSGDAWRRSVEGGNGTGWSETDANFTYADSVLGVGAVEEAYADLDAELLGGETVDGSETYVVSVSAPPERLLRHSSAVIDLHGAGLEEPDGGTDTGSRTEGETEVQNAEAYLWVDRETRRPVRMAHRIALGGNSTDDTDAAANASDGGGGDGQTGAEFLFTADWSYGEGDVEPPDVPSSSSASEAEGT